MVTRACSGAAGSPPGAGMVSRMASSSGAMPEPLARDADAGHGTGGAGVGGDDGELDVVVAGVEVQEQLVDLVDHLVGPGVGAVDLVEHHDGRQVAGQGLGQHVAGLGHGAVGGVDQQEDAVHQGQGPLDLAAEVGVAGGVHQVDAHALPLHRDGLGEDGDAPLPLLVVGVEDPLHPDLVGGEHPGGAEDGVDQGGLAVVDVGDQGDVAEGGGGHGTADGTGAGGLGGRDPAGVGSGGPGVTGTGA